jgi:hypothetical protein
VAAKPGRPAHVPTEKDRKTVEAMASYGIRQEEIALVLGVSEPTLRQHYRRELAVAAIKANAKMAESLFLQGMSKGPGALGAKIFWLKCRAGWVEAKAASAEAAPGYVSKKERAASAAETAGVGTEWGDDLTPRALN